MTRIADCLFKSPKNLNKFPISFFCIKIYDLFSIDSKSGEQINLLFTVPRLIRSRVNDTLSIFAAKSS